jgi:hypothetical protein
MTGTSHGGRGPDRWDFVGGHDEPRAKPLDALARARGQTGWRLRHIRHRLGITIWTGDDAPERGTEPTISSRSAAA